MKFKSLVASILIAFGLNVLGQASFAEGIISFQPITFTDEQFISYPNQSSDGQVIANGVNWGPLQISHDGGVSYQDFNVPDIEPFDHGNQSDWKQVSVSPDGSHIVAATARGNSGGYIYLSQDSGATFTTQLQIGNANWTNAIFGSNTSEVLVVDGVATIWSKAADGTNCNTDVCIGSGEDGSNLQGFTDGGMVRQEQPFAAAYFSSDGGRTWTDAIILPSGADGVVFEVTSLGSRFILKRTEPSSGNEYFELTGISRPATEDTSERDAARRSAIRAAAILESRQEMIEAIGAGSNISTSTLSKAGLDGVSTLTLAYFNNEISKLAEVRPLNFESVRATHEKWASVEKIITNPQFTFKDLVTAGFASGETPFKATILKTLRGTLMNEKDSPAKIQTIIQASILENKARGDRVKKRTLSLK